MTEYLIDEDYEHDPVFTNSYREAVVIIVLFVLFMFWTVGISFWLGVREDVSDVEAISLVWGMPQWVFYGVFLPWMLVNVISVWFCFGLMKTDDLSEGASSLPVQKEEVK